MKNPRKNSRGRWPLDYKDPNDRDPKIGRPKRCRPSFATRAEAMAKMREIEDQLRGGTHSADASKIEFSTLAKAWLEVVDHREEIHDRMSPRRAYNYHSDADNHLIPMFGGYKLSEFEQQKMRFVQRWVDAMMLDGMKSKVVSGIINSMSQCFDHAVQVEGWMKLNPLKLKTCKVRVPAPREEDKKEAIPQDDLEKILKADVEKIAKGSAVTWRTNRIAKLLALCAGMRRGECCGLQWENVLFEEREIVVKDVLVVDPGGRKRLKPYPKSGPRSIHRVRMCRVELEGLRWLASFAKELRGFVLLDDQGGPMDPNSLGGYHWKGTLDRAGLLNEDGSPKYGFHQLRHSFASHLRAQGWVLEDIRDVMGHARLSQTERYTHYGPDARKVRWLEAHRMTLPKPGSIEEAQRLPAPDSALTIDHQPEPALLPFTAVAPVHDDAPMTEEALLARQRARNAQMRADGESARARAAALGRSRQTIRNWDREAPDRLTLKPGRRSAERKAEIAKLRAECLADARAGDDLEEIAERRLVALGTLKRWAREDGVPFRKAMTRDKEKQCIANRRAGMSLRANGRALGVSEGTVANWLIANGLYDREAEKEKRAAQKARVLALSADRVPVAQILQEVDVGETTARRWIAESKGIRRSPAKVGTNLAQAAKSGAA